MCAQQLSTNTFTVAKWVVSADATQGTHTTISGALSSASAGDTVYVRTGTYTENITLKNGVNICGLSSGGGSGQRTVIVGKLIDNGASVNCTINNIALQTNSDNILVLTGGGTVVLEEVYINAINATAISVTSGTAKIVDCVGDLGTTGIAYFTGAGSVALYNSNFTNSGASTTASTISGTVTMNGCQFNSCFSTSAAGAFTVSDSFIDCATINTIAFTSAGTGTSTFYNCEFRSGTASAISVGSGTTVNCYMPIIQSANTNAVTGSGTFSSDAPSYVGTSHLNNVTTKTFVEFGDTGTFTPTLDGSTPGTSTYTTQKGYYTRIGNLVYITGTVAVSAATGTGNATIGGLPFTVKNQASGNPIGSVMIDAGGWAWPASKTQMSIYGVLNSTNCLIGGFGSSTGLANLQMTNATATFYFSMVYQAA